MEGRVIEEIQGGLNWELDEDVMKTMNPLGWDRLFNDKEVSYNCELVNLELIRIIENTERNLFLIDPKGILLQMHNIEISDEENEDIFDVISKSNLLLRRYKDDYPMYVINRN